MKILLKMDTISSSLKKYFALPNTTNEHIDSVSRIIGDREISEEALVRISADVREASRLRNWAGFIFFSVKVAFFFLTAGFIIYEISDLFVKLLSKFADIIISSASDIGPFVSVIFALIIIVGAWEVFMHTVSSRDTRETIVTRLGFGRWRDKIDLESETSNERSKNIEKRNF